MHNKIDHSFYVGLYRASLYRYTMVMKIENKEELVLVLVTYIIVVTFE